MPWQINGVKMSNEIDFSSPISFLESMRLKHYETPTDFTYDMQEQVELCERIVNKQKQEIDILKERIYELQLFVQDRIDEFEDDKYNRPNYYYKALNLINNQL